MATPHTASTHDEESVHALVRAVDDAVSAGAAPEAVAAALAAGGYPEAAARELVVVVGARSRAGAATTGGPVATTTDEAATGPQPTAEPPPAALDVYLASRRELAQRGATRVLMGLLWTVGGAIVTLVSYEAAAEGGRYVLAYGAIAYGLITMAVGGLTWARNRD